MYRWLVFLHIIGLFTFLMAHGVSAGVALRVRSEREVGRLQGMLQLSGRSIGLMYISLLVIVLSWVVAAFIGGWWRWGWLWTSILLLVVVIGAMTTMGSRYYTNLRRAVGAPYQEGREIKDPLPPANPEEIDALVRAGNPALLSVIGVVGILAIAWLMMFKPF
jgi:hypothetical protein